MTKTITVSLKTTYGNNLIYPECATANLLIQLTKGSTFSPKHIKIIEELGYEVIVAQQTLTIPIKG
jgi:hypothetical protein